MREQSAPVHWHTLSWICISSSRPGKAVSAVTITGFLIKANMVLRAVIWAATRPILWSIKVGWRAHLTLHTCQNSKYSCIDIVQINYNEFYQISDHLISIKEQHNNIGAVHSVKPIGIINTSRHRYSFELQY